MSGAEELRGGWERKQLPANVVVGPGCYLEGLHSFGRFRSVCEPGMVIGRDVSVLTWTVFNVEPTGFVEIGDGSTIVGGVFMCAERISVGRGVVISYNVTIADSDFHPMRIADRRADARANAPGGDRSHRPRVSTKPVRIEDEVQVGIGAVILKGVTIGRGATIGAGSVITRDVEPGSVWEGNPGRPVPEGG